MDWLQRLAAIVAREGPVARVVIVGASGPTPRAVGAAMLVTATGQTGKIGRGEIEQLALAEARRLIGVSPKSASGNPVWQRELLRFATGHVLGERTGGQIDLLVEVFAAPEVEALTRQSGLRAGELALGRPLASGVAAVMLTERATAGPTAWQGVLARLEADPHRSLLVVQQATGPDLLVERIAPRLAPFSVYGTGLVARALVRLLADLPFEVTWLDSTPAHFPGNVPERVAAVASTDLAAAARDARPHGFHAVMTASHDLDLAVCRAVLSAGSFAFFGVIGSRLKRERLLARLAADGVAASALARIVCPIGLPEIRGKVPEVIAIAIAAQALIALQGGVAKGEYR